MTRPTPRLALLALVALAAVAACIPGAKAPPQATPTRTLELGAEGEGTRTPKAFAVVFASPKGATVDPSEVTIVFNRPMRPLELAGDGGSESAPPASIAIKGTGAVPKGSWRWIGTSALVFAPDPHLARATEYAVTVPAGTRALDGSALPKPYAFSFATARPSVVGVTPNEGETHLTPTQPIELRFNQPIDPSEAERAIKLRVGASGGKSWSTAPFRASWPQQDNRQLVKLAPSSPLPLGAHLEVVVEAGLRGIEGPLPTGAEHKFEMQTYGPLTVEKVHCAREGEGNRQAPGKCLPGGDLNVELSNRVTMSDWKQHVRIEPAARMKWPSSDGHEKKLSWMTVPITLRAARDYRVVVTAGLKDEFGQVLARDMSFPIEVGDFPVSAEIGMAGEVFEAAAGRRRAIPISTMNLAGYDLLTAALDEKSVAALTAEAHGRGNDTRFDRARQLPGAKLEVVTPAATRNVDAVKNVSLDGLVGPSGKGVAVVGIRYSDRRGRVEQDARVVSVTDLAISAKMSRFGSIVWVTRLGDGRPVSGATVAVLTGANEVFTTQTDAGGVATIPADRYVPLDPSGSPDGASILVARAGDDWTYRRVAEQLGSWRYQVSIDTAARLTAIGMMFTERGVYRPGETVRVKGIFRRPTARGMETPAGREVKLTVFDGNGDSFFERNTKLDAFGELAVDVPVPAAAHMGSAEVRAEIEEPGVKDVERAATASFQLAAYKASEFKVAVEPEKPSYVRGDKASFVVRGDYLFGAPMSNGTVRFAVTRGPGSFSPPGTDGLVLSDDAFDADIRETSERASQFQTGNGALDAKGSFGATVALAMPHQHGTEVVNIEGEVDDVSRQSLAGRSSVIVHPGEFYVAMKPQPDLFVTKGAAVRADVLAVEPSGAVRAGTRVKVELLKRTWHTAVEASGESGTHYQSKAVDRKIAECLVTSAAQLAGCPLTVSDAGYFILRATAKDARGNEVAASTAIYALAGGTEGADVSWPASDSTNLELVTDKKSYEIGDVARVLVKSPFREGEALVTVERSGVFRRELVKLRGATPTVSIPITDDMRPNAFVSVHLVRGRTKAAPDRGQDVGAPAFRLGYAELTVNPELRRLKVALSLPKKEFRPGEDVDVAIALSDRAGKAARGEITFYAVDEGVLMLTGYKTPDPIPVFTQARSLNVFALETRSELARVFLSHIAGAGADKGDQGGGGGGMRADFRATAHFEPSLVTGTDGKAHVRFKLPDNLTTYRLMAVVAAEDDRFGFGEAQLTTSRPIMARPALPRFLRAGDAMDAGVVVSSKGMAAQDVEVTISAQGATVGGDAKRVVALPANGSVEVRWPITTPSAGKAAFTFRVSAGRETDQVQVTREVKVPLSMESVALYGETTENAAEKLGDLRALRTDVGALDVRVASTALVGLGEGAEQLLEYPYGCTEQLLSRLIPLLPLRALAKDYDVKLPGDPGKTADEAIAKILANQKSDGSFGYWTDSPRGDVWVTAYALFGLDLAKKHQRHVPAEALERATKFVRQELAAKAPSGAREADLHLGLAQRAFILDVLAGVGKPDPGYANALYEQRAKMPLFARALLAHAMAGSKMPAAQSQELLRDLEAHLRATPSSATVVDNVGDAYAVLLDSEARTTAMVLRALVAMDPKHALASRLARGLLGARQKGKFRSTQEAAWALLALDDYRHAQEREVPSFDAEVWMNDAQIFSAPFRQRTALEKTTTIPLATLFQRGPGGETLGFRVEGTGRLFYEARLRYAKKELPRDALDRGFFVKKLVRSVSPEALKDALQTLPQSSASSARGGDLVMIDLLVVTPDPREQVVIEDPLPAGLEALQASFETTTSAAGAVDAAGDGQGEGEGDGGEGELATARDARAAGRAFNSAWFHREIQDDRVLTFVEHMPAGMYHYRYLARATTFGQFVVPPTRAECMYEPATFGRTAATTFSVVGR